MLVSNDDIVGQGLLDHILEDLLSVEKIDRGFRFVALLLEAEKYLFALRSEPSRRERVRRLQYPGGMVGREPYHWPRDVVSAQTRRDPEVHQSLERDDLLAFSQVQ